MAIPKVLHLTSKTVPLAGTELRLLNHNTRVLRGWSIKQWSDAENDKLVADQFPQYLDAYRSLPHGVMRADIARLVYLHAEGGWYSDTDYRWFRPPPVDHAAVLPVSRPGRLGNAVFGSEAGHPFWARALESIFSRDDLATTEVRDIEDRTGPIAVTALLAEAEAMPGVWVAPREYFHEAVNAITKSAYGCHLTRGSWRENSLKWRLAMVRGDAWMRVRRAQVILKQR